MDLNEAIDMAHSVWNFLLKNTDPDAPSIADDAYDLLEQMKNLRRTQEKRSDDESEN